MLSDVRIEIARIRGDFAPGPCRQRDVLLRIVDLHFSHDQAVVGAEKFIDLPEQAGVFDFVSNLLDERLCAQMIEHVIGVGERNRVLELGALRRPVDDPRAGFHSEPRMLTGGAHAHRAHAVADEISLANASAAAHLGAPCVREDEILVFNFLRHGRILDCALRIAHCTLHIAHCTLRIAHCALHIAHCTLQIED